MKKSVTYCDDCSKELLDKDRLNILSDIDICKSCMMHRYKLSLKECPIGKLLCESCKGKGQIKVKEYGYHNDSDYTLDTCKTCRGTGYKP